MTRTRKNFKQLITIRGQLDEQWKASPTPLPQPGKEDEWREEPAYSLWKAERPRATHCII